jgi:hypothetical protein
MPARGDVSAGAANGCSNGCGMDRRSRIRSIRAAISNAGSAPPPDTVNVVPLREGPYAPDSLPW